ncbi:MAG: HPr family phosphocarrier protein [Candidatus Carbobacillus altaicus]|uniref:HPr domain-containing protein n=1 Tax=Candidatus Carbonibacillus altaicus TaxID=2163959 RepID=A0A2R6Y2A8_9BACL|nr:HPr family phosphocarrier protein [Candidatus Carbobacillus altaicus]PTQ56775.1 MAG: hypothetical protein BSOLF_2663 [Candidatus Carbobacillus altaicus]
MMLQKDLVVGRWLTRQELLTAVSIANGFQADIHVRKGTKQVNLKSVLGTYSLFPRMGDAITLMADGADAKEALAMLAPIFSGASLDGSTAEKTGPPHPIQQ